MLTNHACPRCGSPIDQERMMAKVIICSCGWSGDKSHFEPPKRNLHIKKIAMGIVALAVIFTGMEARQWGKRYPERVYYKALSTFKMTSAKDEARMAFVCKELGKHKCAADAYTKALRKSPKSYNIAGALAVELSKTGKHERAILTFQNFFSHEEGSDIHKQHFARSLSNQGFSDDATEWYYKALQANAKNFEAARELVVHLSKNENHSEALSVIGHYQTLFPKTRKGWAKLTEATKQAYSKYTNSYEIKEIKISGINKFLHAPVQFAGNSDTKLFLVDPDSEFLTLDLTQLQEMGVEYQDLGVKEVMATNGRYLKGTQVILPELKVGPFTLTKVKAMACDNCAFLLGKSVMKRLNFKAQDNKGVKYITLRQ